jgi:glycosyltransferase involved in cell wall biosynthesis
MTEAKKRKKALVVVQCFPPLLKNAGGVSKRYLTLCRALIDGLGWEVSLLTPVNIHLSKEEEVAHWLKDGSLVHLPARGVKITSSTDGVAVFLDLMSGVNAGKLFRELCVRRDYDCVFTDDVPWRLELLLLARSMGVPTVVTTHTDITHMKSFRGMVRLAWMVHMLSTHIAALHASVSKVFGQQMRRMYGIPVEGVWPPILWSSTFRSDPKVWEVEAREQRQVWLHKLKEQGCEPKAIMMYGGRWSAEKRIHLLFDAVPKDCALVIVGDGTSEYVQKILDAGPKSGRKNVLPMRKMLNAHELRLAYAASDLFLSASNFETLGNTVIEAFTSGTPVAIQPAQGHLEFVKDQTNSWFVNYEDQDEARVSLSRIVASGLDEASLRKSIPEFMELGAKLRQQDFAKEFNTAIVQPALAVGEQQYAGVVEVLKRVLCFIAAILLWLVLRIITRIGFVTMRDPECEVLGPLGGAVDDRSVPTVHTYPCLRFLFGQCRSVDVDRDDEAYGTDYESHFAPARKPWWNRRL